MLPIHFLDGLEGKLLGDKVFKIIEHDTSTFKQLDSVTGSYSLSRSRSHRFDPPLGGSFE